MVKIIGRGSPEKYDIDEDLLVRRMIERVGEVPTGTFDLRTFLPDLDIVGHFGGVLQNDHSRFLCRLSCKALVHVCHPFGDSIVACLIEGRCLFGAFWWLSVAIQTVYVDTPYMYCVMCEACLLTNILKSLSNESKISCRVCFVLKSLPLEAFAANCDPSFSTGAAVVAAEHEDEAVVIVDKN
jgi:hypothetical protein